MDRTIVLLWILVFSMFAGMILYLINIAGI